MRRSCRSSGFTARRTRRIPTCCRRRCRPQPNSGTDRMAKEYLLGKLEDIPEGKGRAFKAGRTTVAVFRANGKVFAINNRCVHKGASMCEGDLTDGGKVVRCPWHNWAFDL